LKIIEENQKFGDITVKTESLNDLWTLYNIISKDDITSARTQRRVVLKEGDKGERKPMNLKLLVKEVSFHEFTNRLRIKGTIIEGPEDFVSFGTYHTFNIEVGQKITINKKNWLKHELKRLKQVPKFESNFIILFIAIEPGLATIALATNFSQNRIATIKRSIPGKRYEQAHRNKALNDFFEDITKVIEENLLKVDINLIITCGPGNTRDQLIKYIKQKSNPPYISKIKSVHASSGTESAILETLKSDQLSDLKKNVKIIEDSELIENILFQLSKDADLVAFGLNENHEASKRGAIEKLLIADVLIRNSSKEQKSTIEEIIINIENFGGIVHILSSEHAPGDQLVNLGSIVGILRYKT